MQQATIFSQFIPDLSHLQHSSFSYPIMKQSFNKQKIKKFNMAHTNSRLYSLTCDLISFLKSGSENNQPP